MLLDRVAFVIEECRKELRYDEEFNRIKTEKL
jgi:hypothetical protein